ncbi:hypothetical protein LTR53_003681 [Teratosphaeriaceae sp. CCFEE 6253]|nr:hypothetical protein LTR53_003681 [Teratosphaeriaceae sp. CCFEE 6253]
MSWYGCGLHVPSVLDSIPEEDRCACEPRVERDGKQYPPQGGVLGVAKAALGLGAASGSGKGGKEEL